MWSLSSWWLGTLKDSHIDLIVRCTLFTSDTVPQPSNCELLQARIHNFVRTTHLGWWLFTMSLCTHGSPLNQTTIIKWWNSCPPNTPPISTPWCTIPGCQHQAHWPLQGRLTKVHQGQLLESHGEFTRIQKQVHPQQRHRQVGLWILWPHILCYLQ